MLERGMMSGRGGSLWNESESISFSLSFCLSFLSCIIHLVFSIHPFVSFYSPMNASMHPFAAPRGCLIGPCERSTSIMTSILNFVFHSFIHSFPHCNAGVGSFHAAHIFTISPHPVVIGPAHTFVCSFETSGAVGPDCRCGWVTCPPYRPTASGIFPLTDILPVPSLSLSCI